MTPRIQVQAENFDLNAELARLQADVGTGAVVNFIGQVRQSGDRDDIVALELEHYPGMTERCLHDLAMAAHQRWPLTGVTVLHRIGRLALGAPIVLVVTASAHRQHAFAACEHIMDFLKTDAPFWKKEINRAGEAQWVAAKASDQAATERWQSPA